MNNAFERECAAAHVCNDDKNIAEKLLSDSRPVKYASTPVDLNVGNDVANPGLLEQMRARNLNAPGPSGAKGSEGVEPAPKVNPLSKKLTLSQADNDVANPELLEQMRAMNLIRPKPEGAKRPEGVGPAPKVNPLSKRVDLKELTTLTAQLLSDRRSS
ncbi:MAG: hypothetical protein IPJ49_28885 [Candidatus Obscuribacter sp.]|nr:hypothetical protein [Candidatus Obscuribacter sp.]